LRVRKRGGVLPEAAVADGEAKGEGVEAEVGGGEFDGAAVESMRREGNVAEDGDINALLLAH
jgi:hypothetical protein